MKLNRKAIARKKWLILAISLIVVLLGGLFGYAEYSSSRYVEKSQAEYEKAKHDVDQQLSADDLSMQSIINIKQLTEQTAAGLCDSPAIAKWRVSQDYQAKCAANQQRLVDVSRQADSLANHLESSNTVGKIFSDATEDLSKAKSGDNSASRDIWKQVRSELENISVAQTYSGLLKRHQSDVERIINRYDKLIAADKAEKRSRFDDAVADLQRAYEKLSESKTELEKALDEQSDALLDSVGLLLAPEVQLH